MIKENVTFTCRIDGTDKTEQRTVTMGYCYATEIAFKDLSGQYIAEFMTEAIPLIQDNKMPDIKKSIYAILSCIIAYYQSMDEDAPIKDTDLMNEATPLEIGTAFGTVLKLRGEFYHIPNGEPAEIASERKGQGKKLSNAHDIYQLLVGEIGIPRREFLYDLHFWEVRRIVRGYSQRDRLKHQLIAECAYAAMYAMRDPQGKGVEDIFPMLFEDDYDEPPISEEDVADMQAMMDAFNNSINEQNNKQL